jgi:mannose-6-phosphate isomerase-like protein (cupin superfamily)
MAKLTNINQQAIDNPDFRRVLATGEHTQIVIMSIPAGGEIGSETHPDNDQMLYLVHGHGACVLNGEEQSFEAGDLVLVPAGTEHNFIAAPDAELKIITTYSPPHHPDGTIHHTKAEADAAEANEG